MLTELEIVTHVVNPGRKIQVHSKPIRNYHLHQVTEQLSQLALGMMESDSGNSSAQNSARETRSFWSGFGLARQEWEHAKAFRDSPHASHEYQYDILLPTPNEVMSIKNLKLKRVVSELIHLAEILVGLDSSGMQTWVGPGDVGEIEECIQHCEDVMTTYLGTGAGSADAGYDTGLTAPKYAYGTLIPGTDRNAKSMWEPSSEGPPSPVPDVADLDSLAPRPGLKQQ